MATYQSPVRPRVERYLERAAPKPDALLKKMIAFARRHDVPCVSRDVGDLLYQLVSLGRPKRIVECGTAIGMSTLFLARALRECRVGGTIDTLDVSAERHGQAREFLTREGLGRYVTFHTEPALGFLRRNRRGIDLLFLDAVKAEYERSVRLALPRMKSGGVIVADNLLWHGYVAGARTPKAGFWAQSTKALRAFNRFFLTHPKLEARIYAIGDGTGVALVR